MKRCEVLAANITEIYNLFKENPNTVKEYISFTNSYQAQKVNVPTL